MKSYYEIFKITIKNSLAYKLDTIINIFGSIITLYVQIYLWKALYNSNDIVEISINEMIRYQIIGVLLSLIYNNSVTRDVGSSVIDGSISIEMIRPYNYALNMFSRTLGKTVSGLAVKGIPVVVFSIIAFNFRINVSISQLLLFVFVMIANIMIYWLMHYIIGLLHFIFINAGWFERILGDTIRILGGGVIPLWFFPGILRKASIYLPFQLLYQLPQSLLINKISYIGLIQGICMEVLWLVILSWVAYMLWKVGMKKLVIQGG